jgi:hypothetical protein
MKIILIAFVLLIAVLPVCPQGLSIGSETTLSLCSSTLYLPNNWKNDGSLISEYGTVVFNGEDGNQTLESLDEDIFSFLVVNKTSGDLQLINNITVNGGANIISGDIDGNDNVLILGPGLNGDAGAYLNENSNNTFKNGFLFASRTLSPPDTINLMGLTIISQDNFGYTEVSRGHYAQTGNENVGILRYFNVAAANDENLNVKLIFQYDESELNGLTEEELILFRSADEGATWTEMGGIIDTDANTVTLDGIDSFPIDLADSHTRWTLASNSAQLPVELAELTAVAENDYIKISWQTKSEINNRGFDVERQVSSRQLTVVNPKSEIRNGNWLDS